MIVGVITTIYPDSPAIPIIGSKVDELILVADRKTPVDSPQPFKLMTLEEQNARFPKLAPLLPYDHYVRKNLGYLHAITSGAGFIYDADDDNFPYDTWTIPRPDEIGIVSGGNFANAYRLFCSDKIWPRGLPLDSLAPAEHFSVTKAAAGTAPVHVWQGLANGAPDVDAVWRLVYNTDFYFPKTESSSQFFALQSGTFCPFNSQNTLWVEPSSFIFTYLPCTVGFRFTDILRSYVATFGIWARSGAIGFTPPTVEQKRNPHSNLKDFNDETEMYAWGSRLFDLLASSRLRGADEDLLAMYDRLAQAGVVKSAELAVVEQWLGYASPRSISLPTN